MGAAHTPGPWSIEGDADDAEASIVNREHSGMDWDVCTVHSSAANARLIAASPDLLAFAQGVVELERLTSLQDIAAGLGVLLEHARAAIAKTEAPQPRPSSAPPDECAHYRSEG